VLRLAPSHNGPPRRYARASVSLHQTDYILYVLETRGAGLLKLQKGYVFSCLFQANGEKENEGLGLFLCVGVSVPARVA